LRRDETVGHPQDRATSSRLNPTPTPPKSVPLAISDEQRRTATSSGWRSRPRVTCRRFPSATPGLQPTSAAEYMFLTEFPRALHPSGSKCEVEQWMWRRPSVERFAVEMVRGSCRGLFKHYAEIFVTGRRGLRLWIMVVLGALLAGGLVSPVPAAAEPLGAGHAVSTVAAVGSGLQSTQLTAVSCPTSTWCVAVGELSSGDR
jgi:hypothetical protein